MLWKKKFFDPGALNGLIFSIGIDFEIISNGFSSSGIDKDDDGDNVDISKNECRTRLLILLGEGIFASSITLSSSSPLLSIDADKKCFLLNNLE